MATSYHQPARYPPIYILGVATSDASYSQLLPGILFLFTGLSEDQGFPQWIVIIPIVHCKV